MNLWPIILILLAIAMVAGPIMMFKPSNRDRRLSELRQAAAQNGLHVRMTTIPCNGAPRSVAIYSMPLDKIEEDKGESRVQWALLKGDLSHDVHFDNRWNWKNNEKMAPKHYHDGLLQLIRSFDPSIMGVEVTYDSIGVYWTEQKLTFDQVQALLKECKTDFGD